MWRCPQCGEALSDARTCGCGFEIRRQDGILDLMTPRQAADYADFCAAYERIRTAEGWGGDDLDLPLGPRGHESIWAIRRRTFLKLQNLIQSEGATGGAALDVGAGNCWLTHHLEGWGFRATALDVNAGGQDGLRAGAYHLARGDRFERVRAPMEALPLANGSFDLVVANGALHYAADVGTVIREFLRVLRNGGRVVVMDTPWYEDPADGRRAVAGRVEEFCRLYGLDEELSRRASFLSREAFSEVAEKVGFNFRLVPVWPGPMRALGGLRARLARQRIASFPLILIGD